MMRFWKIWVLPVLCLIVVGGCSGGGDGLLTGDQEFPVAYQEAIADAMVAEEGEIWADLTVIDRRNDELFWQEHNGVEYVLVTTWTQYPDSYAEGNWVDTWWGETWVTVVPEIRDWFGENPIAGADLTLRVEQLLGLPPGAGDTHFVEIWVRPQDLFRPAPDNEIDDSVALLAFPASVEPEYREWFNNNLLFSYFPPRYPWTRLGYTYDWGNPDSDIGLSEFVLKEDSRVLVESVEPTADYLPHDGH